MGGIHSISLAHSWKYPKMEIQDFIKLIYQNVFGPRHFSDFPDENTILSYRREELMKTHSEPESPFVEDIGNGYCRIYLEGVQRGALTEEALGQLFFRTMMESSEIHEEILGLFHQEIEVLSELIRTGEIGLPWRGSLHVIQKFLEHGIGPIHHSAVYVTNYHPHYRVVKKSFVGELR